MEVKDMYMLLIFFGFCIMTGEAKKDAWIRNCDAWNQGS
jgi:hypothetical protein